MLFFSIQSQDAIIEKKGGDLSTTPLDQNDPECLFCGYRSKNNRRYSMEPHPLHPHPSALSWIDPLCEAWQHLDALPSERGFVIYLPEMPPEDVNHLQRATFFALQSPDPIYREDAKALMNWLAAHKKEAEAYWGTSDPRVFAQALRQANRAQRHHLQRQWQHLALILRPKAFGKGIFNAQGKESNTATWARLYQDFMSHDLF